MRRKTRYQKLRDEAARPRPHPDGIFIRDPFRDYEEFVSFDELKHMCTQAQNIPDHMSEAIIGKPPYRDDPSYFWRRKRAKV